MRSGPILVSLAVPIHSLLQGRPKIESVIYNVVHSVHLIWSALVNIRRKARTATEMIPTIEMIPATEMIPNHHRNDPHHRNDFVNTSQTH